MFNLFNAKAKKFYPIGLNYCESNIEMPLDHIEAGIDIAKKIAGKVYTKKEIDEISQLIEDDANRLFVFVEEEEFSKKYNNKLTKTIKGEYKWIKSLEISSPDLESMFQSEIKKNKLYKRTEIELLSQKIGCSVFDRNEFQYLTINELSIGNEVIFKIINGISSK